jgi:hypothetical protein
VSLSLDPIVKKTYKVDIRVDLQDQYWQLYM